MLVYFMMFMETMDAFSMTPKRLLSDGFLFCAKVRLLSDGFSFCGCRFMLDDCCLNSMACAMEALVKKRESR